jgi:hypothetical protein
VFVPSAAGRWTLNQRWDCWSPNGSMWVVAADCTPGTSRARSTARWAKAIICARL